MQPGPYAPGYPPPPPPPPPRRTPTWVWVVIALVVSPCGLGVMAAVAIPSFVRYLRAAKQTEAVARLEYLCRRTQAYAAQTGALPPSAPRTPADVPRGVRVVDAPGTWTAPTWQALAFDLTAPHYYSYEFVSDGTSFAVRAYGDLDGNGVESTFERQGTLAPGEGVRCGTLVRVNENE